MGLFENIKNNLKEASDGEMQKLRDELRYRADDLNIKLSDEDISDIAERIKHSGFFISNDIFTDSNDEYEWQQINDFLDDEIRYYRDNILKESDTVDSNLTELNDILGEWDFIGTTGDVTDPYISYLDIKGDTISVGAELWDPELDDYVSIDAGTITAPEIIKEINSIDFEDGINTDRYTKANDILQLIYPKLDWEDVKDRLYGELRKQRGEEDFNESSKETKANRKPLKITDATEQAYMDYVKEWFDERDFNWRDELSYWSGKQDNWDMSDYKKLFDGLYEENGINGELFVSYDEWLNNEYMEEAEHPLDFKKYEVTIKRDNGLGDLTTIMINTSEDAVRDYVTGKGYEVVNIKELGYPGGNPENKNELQNKANKVVRNMAKMRESQTQEIDAVLKALKEKNPNIEKYLNEYYKSIADTEPRPAYDKEKDRMDPAWENWNKTTNNVLYSREAWENFTNWVKEKYGENLNETEELKEGSDYWNDKFGQEALDEYKNNQDKNGIPKGKTPFKVGDPVYYSYLSDNNKHNGVVGNIEWLRKYQYYPFGHKGDSNTVIYKWQGSIKYPDGSTESIGDAYAKGGGVTSPLRIAPKEFKPGDKIPWDYEINEAEDKKGPTLEEDEYNAVDYFLTDSKMYDSGFYLKQDKNMKDYFVDAEDNNKKYSLKNGLHVIYEAMVPEYVAEYPKDIQKGLEKVMRKYLGDQIGDEIKSWCSKPKKEAESIKTVCGLEDGKSYWAYVSKHGLGPGTIPNDVEATCVSELPETGKTLFCVDRQLTPEELDKYELALFDNSYFNKYPEVIKELMALK